jgi:secreted trypsin-like serine protease
MTQNLLIATAILFTIVGFSYCAHSGGLIDDLLRDVQQQTSSRSAVQQIAPTNARLLDPSRQPEATSARPGPGRGELFDQSAEARRSISTESPQTVPIAAYPWIVGLFNERRGPADGYFCAGVSIGGTWVLTTAYCADAAARMNTASVIFGTSALQAVGEKSTIAGIKGTKIHPKWNQETHENDVAILQIAPLSDRRPKPILLSELSATEYVGAIGQVVGWGITNRTQPRNDTLQLIQTQILSNAVCSGLGGYGDQIPKGQFCAQSLLKEYDACNGFGGSPLVLNDNTGRRLLAGIVSWGTLCPPDGHKPSVYTDITPFKAWLTSEIPDWRKAQ